MTDDTSDKRSEIELERITVGASGYVTESCRITLKSLSDIKDLEKDALLLWEKIKK